MTNKELKEMTLQDAIARITSSVYRATCLFEQLEHCKKVSGSGHRQKVSKFAKELMIERWMDSNTNDKG